ncbi:MAG: hypothetical protein MUD07_00035 [Burkholderiaceae bacterium]|jgi:hypothetical protein|nr:hypothetical protein [Burkholderiaceae bacterium]
MKNRPYFFFGSKPTPFASLGLTKSPITVFTGQTDTIGHLLQVTAMAMGQSVMAILSMFRH